MRSRVSGEGVREEDGREEGGRDKRRRIYEYQSLLTVDNAMVLEASKKEMRSSLTLSDNMLSASICIIIRERRDRKIKEEEMKR